MRTRIPTRLAIPTLALLALALLPPTAGAQQGTGPAAAATGPAIRFSHGHVVDVQRLAGEPALDSDSEGNLYVTGPIGVQYAHSFLWKSEDGGDSFDLLRAFPPMQRPMPSAGSGDSDLAITPPRAEGEEDAVVWSDMINLSGLANAATFDGGNTFPPDYWNVFATEPTADRQWLTSAVLPDGTHRVYQVYNQVFPGGLSVIYTDDYGQTWQEGQRDISNFSSVGNIAAHAGTGKVYIAFANGDEVTVANAGLDAHEFQPVVAHIGEGGVGNLFVSVDVDTAGNVYVAWIDSASWNVFMATSKDQGQTWSRARRVNTLNLQTGVFPWIVAGDPGRVWVAWYGTKNPANPPDNRGPWHVYGAQSVDALSTDSSWRVVRLSEHVIHDNEICLSGIGCTTEQGEDRNMLDDFTADIDPQGMLHVSYNDSNNQVGESSDPDAGGAYIFHVRQESGPSLYGSVGTVIPKPGPPSIGQVDVSGSSVTVTGRHSLPAGNWGADPKGDSPSPRHGPTCPCPNNPFLDLTRSGLQLDGQGRLIAHLHMNSLPETPVEVNATVEGRTVMYQLFFWVDGNIYFAALTTDGKAYAGQPGFIPNQSGVAKIATYQPDPLLTELTTFKWESGHPGSVHIVIPRTAVPAVDPSDRIDQVTGFVHVLEAPLPGGEVFMDEREATPATSWIVGQEWRPDGRVELSMDDPSFSSPVVANLIRYQQSNVWRQTFQGLSPGEHRIYARQVVDGVASNVVSEAFTIPGSG